MTKLSIRSCNNTKAGVVNSACKRQKSRRLLRGDMITLVLGINRHLSGQGQEGHSIKGILRWDMKRKAQTCKSLNVLGPQLPKKKIFSWACRTPFSLGDVACHVSSCVPMPPTHMLESLHGSSEDFLQSGLLQELRWYLKQKQLHSRYMDGRNDRMKTVKTYKLQQLKPKPSHLFGETGGWKNSLIGTPGLGSHLLICNI